MELNIGQKVAYPGQGVCVLEEIEEKKINGSKMSFYALRILSDDSTIWVPMDNAENVGIRPIISTVQCKKLIRRLSADFDPVSNDWKTRSREFGDKLRSGDVFEAADVLKKLTFLGFEKKLSFREQSLLDKSKFLIISELTNADSADADELSEDIDRLVGLACKKHTNIQPTVMAAASH